jgi:hypothetical protein
MRFEHFHLKLKDFNQLPFTSRDDDKTYLNFPKIDHSAVDWDFEKKTNPTNDESKKWFEWLESARAEKINLGIMRVTNRTKSLYIDFDFKLPPGVHLNRVNIHRDDLRNIQNWVLEALEQCSHIPHDKIYLRNFVDFLVLQRNEDIDPQTRKFGIHLEFPFLMLDNGSDLINCMKHIKMNNQLSFPHEKTVEDCLDNCMNKAWYLYGSGKKSNKNLYEITYLCPVDDEIRPYDHSSPSSMIEFFKKHALTDWNGNEIKLKRNSRIENKLIQFLDPAHFCKGRLPVFSCLFNQEVTTQIDDEENVVREAGIAPYNNVAIETLLMGMKSEWSSNYNMWLRVAYCLKKHFVMQQQEEIGLNLFHEFSKRDPTKYDVSKTISQWNSITRNQYDKPENNLIDLIIGRRDSKLLKSTLATQDGNHSQQSSQSSQIIENNSINFVLEASIKQCSCQEKKPACDETVISFTREINLSKNTKQVEMNTIRWILGELLLRQIIRLPNKSNDSLLVFNGHSSWMEQKIDTVKANVQTQITDIIFKFPSSGRVETASVFDDWFTKLRSIMIPHGMSLGLSPDAAEKAMKKSCTYQGLEKLHTLINNNKTFEDLFKAKLGQFNVDDLIRDKLLCVNNQNLGIVPFTNGVFDCYNGTFRNAKNLVYKHKITRIEQQKNKFQSCVIDSNECSEVFTKTTNFPFEENTQSEIHALMQFMRNILPDEEILNFFFDILAESTFGRNFHNKIVQMIGKGANGKSTLTKILEFAFGDMFQAMSSSSVNETSVRKQTGGPDSFLMQITNDHVRLITMADIPNFKFDHSLLKKLSGLDGIPVRELFQTACTRTCGAMILFGGNSVIRLTAMEPAMVRRLIFIPFDTTFVTPNEYALMTEETRRRVRIKLDISDSEMQRMGKTLMVFLCNRQTDRIREAKERGEIRRLELPQVLKKYQEDCIFRTTNFLEYVKTRFKRSDSGITEAAQIREAFLNYEGTRRSKHELLTQEMVENMLESVFEKIIVRNNAHFKIESVQVDTNLN